MPSHTLDMISSVLSDGSGVNGPAKPTAKKNRSTRSPGRCLGNREPARASLPFLSALSGLLPKHTKLQTTFPLRRRAKRCADRQMLSQGRIDRKRESIKFGRDTDFSLHLVRTKAVIRKAKCR
jgi:hypothetical protein